MSLPDLSSFQSDPLAAPVMAQMTAAKWRKARDSAKELYKKDKAKYLPLLIAANAGLAEEMLERGLLTDAEAVISYLKTIAPPATTEALEKRRSQRQSAAVLTKGTPGDALAHAWHLVSTAITPEAARGTDAARGTEFQLAADRLAVSQQLPPGTDAPELRAEWTALRKAIDATANAAWDEAKAALRGIPAQSVFGSWRLFLRGVRCVHSGELDAARQCFEALPAGTAAARAAWAYRPVCGLPAGTDLPAAAARATYPAALCGASSKAAAAIAEADVLWRKKDLASAYGVLGPAFGRGEFPTEKPGIAGTLTDLFLGNDFRGNLLESTSLDDLLDWIDLRLERSTGLPPVEEKLMRLQLLRLDGPALDPDEVLYFAEKIIALDAKDHGPAPLRAAAVWERAAEALKTARDENSPELSERCIPHAERAIALQHCVELDPQDPARRALMLEQFTRAEDQKGFQTQIRQALADFPEHPGILSMAALAAMEQGDNHAPDLLRKALRLDPGNEAAAAALFEYLVGAERAAWDEPMNPVLWNEMESLSKPTPSPAPDVLAPEALDRLRWFLRMRRVIAESAPDSAPPLINAVISQAPSLFIGHLTAGILANLPISQLEPAATRQEDGAKITWNDLIWVLHLMQWHLEDRQDSAWVADMENYLSVLAAPLIEVKALCTPEGAKGVLAFARATFVMLDELDYKPDHALPNRFILTVAEAVNHLMPRKMNYQAAIASVMLPAQALRHGYFLPCRCPELEQAALSAFAAKDRTTANLAKKLINECGDIPAPPWVQGPPKKKAATVRKAPAKKASAKKVPAKKAAAKSKTPPTAAPPGPVSTPVPDRAPGTAEAPKTSSRGEAKTSAGKAAAQNPPPSAPQKPAAPANPPKANAPQFTQPDLF